MADDAGAKIPAYQQVSRRTVPVDAAGAFAVPAVPEGRFRVSAVAGLPPDMYLADVRQSAQSVFDTGFDVNSGNTAPLEIVLATGAGTVTGVVLDGPMKVVPAATVVLVPETNVGATARCTLALPVMPTAGSLFAAFPRATTRSLHGRAFRPRRT